LKCCLSLVGLHTADSVPKSPMPPNLLETLPKAVDSDGGSAHDDDVTLDGLFDEDDGGFGSAGGKNSKASPRSKGSDPPSKKARRGSGAGASLRSEAADMDAEVDQLLSRMDPFLNSLMSDDLQGISQQTSADLMKKMEESCGKCERHGWFGPRDTLTNAVEDRSLSLNRKTCSGRLCVRPFVTGARPARRHMR